MLAPPVAVPVLQPPGIQMQLGLGVKASQRHHHYQTSGRLLPLFFTCSNTMRPAQCLGPFETVAGAQLCI
jgi:hypothetical protein